MMDRLIAAVRADRLVGRGSCSSIDECYEDVELAELLADCKTEKEAIATAHKAEGLFLEQGLNQRWGDDDDPQLLAWERWQKEGKK